MVSFSITSLFLFALAVAALAAGNKNFDCIKKNWPAIKAHLDKDSKGNVLTIKNLPESLKVFVNKDGTIVASPSDGMITNGLKGLDTKSLSDLTNGIC